MQTPSYTQMPANVLPFRPRYEPPTDEQWAILEVTNGLRQLILAYGEADVLAWVRGKRGAPQGLYNAVEQYGADRIERWVLNLAPVSRGWEVV